MGYSYRKIIYVQTETAAKFSYKNTKTLRDTCYGYLLLPGNMNVMQKGFFLRFF